MIFHCMLAVLSLCGALRGSTADRPFVSATTIMASSYTLDERTTHDALVRCSTCTEGGWFFTGSRSTAKIAVAWAAFDVAGTVGSYEWKKHVRNRWLNKAWLIFPAWRTGSHLAGAVQNIHVDARVRRNPVGLD